MNADHYKGTPGRASSSRFRGGMSTGGIKNITHEGIVSTTGPGLTAGSKSLKQPVAQFDCHTKALHEQGLRHGSLYTPAENFWSRPVAGDEAGRQGELKEVCDELKSHPGLYQGGGEKFKRKQPWLHGMTANGDSRQAIMKNAVETEEYMPPNRPAIPARHEISFKQHSNRPTPCLRPFPEIGQRPMSGTGWFPATKTIR